MGLPEEVVQIPVARLKTFPEHPFYVRDDDMMSPASILREKGVALMLSWCWRMLESMSISS